MSLEKEWIKTSLYAEEDCFEAPTTRRNVAMTPTPVAMPTDCIVLPSKYAAQTTTLDYIMVVGRGTCRDNGQHENLGQKGACRKCFTKQRLPDCPRRDAVKTHISERDTDGVKQFVRAVDGKTFCQGHHGSVWIPGTFQPPAPCQDWALEMSSPSLSFRNKTPSCQEDLRSTDCTIHYTDHGDLPTDCIVLPSKYVVPNMIELPDADEMASLARGGRGIVGSEKTIGWDAAVTEPEVPGCTLGSCSCGHMGGWAG